MPHRARCGWGASVDLIRRLAVDPVRQFAPPMKATGRESWRLRPVVKKNYAGDFEFEDCGARSGPRYSPQGEHKKKRGGQSGGTSASQGAGDPGDSLAAFTERLRDLCKDDGTCHGQDREECIRAQAEHAVALAAELGCLREPGVSWAEFLALCTDAMIGTEHMVELDTHSGLVGKTTIPPGFGLAPVVRRHPLAVLRPESGGPDAAESIEFVSATPLEYLSRWLANNDVFGDDVRLASVIRWRDGVTSLGITQPQYHGVPAEPRQIEAFFHEAGWTRLNDPSGHAVFFNYAFGVLAIDAETRNCYINRGGLQPFDVIVCEPDEALERYLRIYPR